MALTASALVIAAKRRTYGAQGKQKISNAMLLEELTYQDQMIVQMFSQIAPELLATVTGSIVLTDVGNLNGYTLDSGIHYRDFVHIDSADDKYKPIGIVRRKDRDILPPAPSGMIRTASAAGVFYPIDPLGKRWSGSDTRSWFEPDEGHTVSYSYVPLAGQVSAMTSTLTSPDMAREALVSSLELRILLSASPMDEVRVQEAVTKRDAAFSSLRMQAYKFISPEGSPSQSRQTESDSDWVNEQVSG